MERQVALLDEGMEWTWIFRSWAFSFSCNMAKVSGQGVRNKRRIRQNKLKRMNKAKEEVRPVHV